MTSDAAWMDTPRGKELLEILAVIQRRKWEREQKEAKRGD